MIEYLYSEVLVYHLQMWIHLNSLFELIYLMSLLHLNDLGYLIVQEHLDDLAYLIVQALLNEKEFHHDLE